MIAGAGCYFSSSGAAPLPRELDPLFGGEVSEPPKRIGRAEHLTGPGHAVRRFNADVHAPLVERMRAPGRPGEPQCTNGEQRRNRQEQTFCFRCFYFSIHGDSLFTLATALCADYQELARDLERRLDVLVRSAGERERTTPSRTGCTLEIAARIIPTAAPNTQQRRRIKQVLEIFGEMEKSQKSPEFQPLLDFTKRTRGGIGLSVLQQNQILALEHRLKLLNLVNIDDYRSADAQELM